MDAKDPRQRFPDVPMSEDEAREFVELETKTGQPVRKEYVARIVLLLFRMDANELDRAIQWMKQEGWGQP